MSNAHPFELAEMTQDQLEEACPPTDRSPPSDPVKEKPVKVDFIGPGHKEYANFQEFWDDPCWGGPIDWKAR